MSANRVALLVALPVSGACAVAFGVLALAGGAESGAVTVRSTPAEASVFVDGAFRGVTPVAISGLSPGSHSVRIETSGFRTLFAAIASSDGVAEFGLPPLDTGRLDVSSEPAGAEIYLDGRFCGVAPIAVGDVRPGTHVVRAEKTGHDPATVSAMVSAARREVVHLKLEDRVLRYLEYAARENPDDMLTHMELGHYYMVIGETDKAASAYFRAKVLSSRPQTDVNYRRKLERTIRVDRAGKLGAKMGAELDRLLRERADSGGP